MKNQKAKLANIKKFGNKAIGQRAYIRYLEGKRLSILDSVKSKCYDCSSYFCSGLMSCNVDSCHLFPWMPYNEDRKKK